MEQKENFGSLAELDSYLLTIKKDEVVVPTEEPVVDPDIVDEIPDLDDLDDEEVAEEVEEVVEEPKPQEPEVKHKRTKQEKEEYSFAKLRKEASENKKLFEERDALIRQLMKEGGFSEYDEFKKALTTQLSAKEMKEKGYTPEQYSELEALRAENKRIADELASRTKREVYDKASKFDGLVQTYADKADMTKTEVYSTLEGMGYNVETLLAQPNPEVLLKGALADKLGKPVQEVVKKKVDTKKLTPAGDQKPGLSIDDILKSDLSDYKQRRGL